jgi:hypothetical protein
MTNAPIDGMIIGGTFHPPSVAILIPSYRRPASVARVAANLRAVTPGEGADWAAYVIAEAEDPSTVDAAHAAGLDVIINRRTPSYAGAINTAHKQLTSPILFTGADDLAFQPGWLDEALAVLDADPTAQVVGTNDLCNPYVADGTHATHYLVRRGYLDDPGGCIDGPGRFLFEGYRHNFTDTEFIGTARARGVFQPCLSSIVEHLHYTTGKSVNDPTYEKGMVCYGDDQATYAAREPLWTQ